MGLIKSLAQQCYRRVQLCIMGTSGLEQKSTPIPETPSPLSPLRRGLETSPITCLLWREKKRRGSRGCSNHCGMRSLGVSSSSTHLQTQEKTGGVGGWSENDKNWELTNCLLSVGCFSVLKTKAWRPGEKHIPIKIHSSVWPGLPKHLATLGLNKTEVLWKTDYPS